MISVEEAKANLWNYINSLPPDRKAEAIAYQHGLEEEAALTKGGMQVVLEKRLKLQQERLKEVNLQLLEIVSEHAAKLVIAQVRK